MPGWSPEFIAGASLNYHPMQQFDFNTASCMVQQQRSTLNMVDIYLQEVSFMLLTFTYEMFWIISSSAVKRREDIVLFSIDQIISDQ